MINLTKPVIVNAALPIERLAEKLPLSKLDELRAIHAAGESNDYSRQMKLLESLRKDISGDISDPKTNPMLKTDLRSCIEATDLMRAQAEMKMSGLEKSPELKLAGNKSLMPLEISGPMTALRSLASSAGPEVSREASLFEARVGACAKLGQFAMIEKYSTQMLSKLRDAHEKSDQPQPQLGIMAARVRDVASAANDIEQKLQLGTSQTVKAGNVPDSKPENSKASAPTKPQIFSPGSYLFSSLKNRPEDSSPEKKKTFGPGH